MAGFTLVELAVVMTIMMIIIAITVPGYRIIVLRSKEETLREDLRIMRKMIDQYGADKQKAPQNLQDLVQEKYLPEVPVDPMTQSADTWEVILEENPLSLSGERGIVDVKSGSSEPDSTGAQRYSDW